jgi:GNAT superfamily N-acetyltransferase
MTDVLIRPASAADLDAMVRLLGALFTLEPDFVPDPTRQKRGLAMLLGDPRAKILVAERAGAVVGMATVQLLVSTAEGDLAGLVEDVIVEESLRGEGIGRQLVEAIEEWARARNATRLQLLTEGDNAPALAFYERIGWHPTRLVCLRRGGVRVKR